MSESYKIRFLFLIIGQATEQTEFACQSSFFQGVKKQVLIREYTIYVSLPVLVILIILTVMFPVFVIMSAQTRMFHVKVTMYIPLAYLQIMPLARFSLPQLKRIYNCV